LELDRQVVGVSATTSGAVKAHLESTTPSLGIPFFRDRAPKKVTLPFGVIQEGISVVPVPMGDTGDQAAEKVVAEDVQVAIYEVWRDAEGRMIERYDLPDKVFRRLQGALLPGVPSGWGAVQVLGRVRLPQVEGPAGLATPLGPVGGQRGDDGANVVANIFTCRIRRSA
jgi:hypothetical protein